MSEPTRADAWELLCEWTESDSLRKHALAVEASMRLYAGVWGEDEERYAITGLVHDCPRWRQKYAAMLEMHKFLTLAITGLRLRSCECPNKMIAIIIKVLTEEG